jgi:hypothetical protein
MWGALTFCLQLLVNCYMLERLFTSKSRVKILEFLFLNSAGEFHLREISR